tara:strand:- start:12949 stop:13593 length:645 start_codon:yes stop_codon:yes gene_type:complete
MDLTQAAPLRFSIIAAVDDSEFINTTAPVFTRKILKPQPRAVKKILDGKEDTGFFTPKENKTVERLRKTETEEVYGTIWSLGYTVGTADFLLAEAITTKELKTFLLQEGVNTRTNTAIAWIDTTLAYPKSHANKFIDNTAVDYTIREVHQYVASSKLLFEGTEVGGISKHFNTLAENQIADNDEHKLLVAMEEDFDITNSVRKAELASQLGIIF